jgi:hypothetical protein
MNSFALRKVNISALTRERGKRDYRGGYYGSLGTREFLIKRNGRYGEGYYGSLGIRERNYLTKEWAQSLTLRTSFEDMREVWLGKSNYMLIKVYKITP